MQKIDNPAPLPSGAGAKQELDEDRSGTNLIAGAKALPALAGKQELLARLKSMAVRLAQVVVPRTSPKEDMLQAVTFEVTPAKTEGFSSLPASSGIAGIDDRTSYLAMASAQPTTVLRAPSAGNKSLLSTAAFSSCAECGRRCPNPKMCRNGCLLSKEKSDLP